LRPRSNAARAAASDTGNSSTGTISNTRPIGPVRACRCESLGIAHENGEHRLVAVQPIAEGKTIFRLEGEITAKPTRYSVQIGKTLHLDSGSAHAMDDVFDRYYWRFMNHACDPSAVIRGGEVIARRDIAPWEDVTFNYNTTEYDMAEPFVCRCGSVQCEGTIRGAKHLSPKRRAKLRPMMAPHLLDG